MPLIILSGYPCSGKSHRAAQLAANFRSRIASASTSSAVSKLQVHIISDETLNLATSVYGDVKVAEKDARAAAMSAIKRLLTRDALVIADGLNYIKGFRYQLFCEAKALQTTSCVVHVGVRADVCRAHNAARIAGGCDRAYDPEVFDNLVFRFEEPNGMARWDSPLFTVVYEDAEPDCDAVWEALVGSDGARKVVRAHQATVLKPAMAQNYLYELDQGTSEIVARILGWQKDHEGEAGGSVAVAEVESAVELPTGALTLPQLQRMRRQFITLNRQHSLDKARIKTLFVDYLNDAFRS